MGKIGDLFVRLGLKKDGYSKGLKEAKAEGASFGKSLSVIGSKAKLAFGVAVAAVAGFVKALKDLGEQNQTLGDAVAKTAAGLNAMWDTMKTSIASLDFSNLLDNLREANRLARDLYDAQDAMGEIGTSYNISLAEQLKHINDLKLALRDQSLSDDERIAKGNELLEIYKKLEQNPTRGLGRLKDTTLDYYMQRMGVVMEGRTDEELAAMRKKYVDFFKWLGTAQGEQYSEAAQKVSRTLGGLDSDKGRAYMRNAANNGMDEYARLAYEYNKGIGDKDREKIEAAVVGYYRQEAHYSEETLRIQTQINSIKAEGSREGASAADAQRKQAENVLKRAQDSAKSEIQILYEKYQEEKKLLEQYGFDTEALAAEFNSNFSEAMSKALEVKVPVEIEFEFPDEEDLNLDFVDEEIQRFIASVEDEVDRMQELAAEFTDAIINGFGAGFQELTNQLFGLEDINPGRIVQALLEPFADMAIKEGEILMASGLGIEAVKTALESLQGPVAIAAGAALIAIGAAAKSGLAALAKSGGRGTSASTYSSSSSGSSGQQNFQTEMTVYVKGTIRGSDIVLSGQKTVNSWGR